MRRGNLIETLEALYAIDDHPDDQNWMRALVHALPPLVPNALGANGLMYDLSRKPPKVWALVNKSSPLESEILAGAVESSTDQYANEIARISVSTASEVPGFEEQAWLNQHFRPRGIEDVLTLNAYNPNGIGCSIAHPVSARLRLSKQDRRTMTRLSSHLAAATRLRLRLRKLREDPDAILTSTGNAVHADGRAKLKAAREALRDATQRMERARARRSPREPEAVLENWRPLVSARWTLIEHFESDGKRYVLARANEPVPGDEEILTPRERQIVALAATGRHSKLIAYDLGVSDSTVRVLIARSMRKLGAKSRADLLRIAAARFRKPT